ncbi:LPS-assembly protein LptD [Neptuniibacter sp. PT8_73]|uniref:LPS-assembly protein LptD n=1 Tax=Neptuniibacter sp. PT8_73 TaxID=3398206 RepID=UPI0039F4CCD1
MPFAKRSTYTLTLAISAALVSSYATAENKPSEQEMAWSCSMTKDGEWDCSVNEELVNQTEAAKQKPQESVAQQPVSSTPSSEATPVEIKTATPAQAAPIPRVRQENVASVPVTTQTRSSVKAKATNNGVWDCIAGTNGEWLCNDEIEQAQHQPQLAIETPTQTNVQTTVPAVTSHKPIQTAEVIGSEWQCGTSPSGDWDCHKVNIHALSLPKSQQRSGVSEPLYNTENPYSHLDWAYYKDPQGQQCAGRYLEPSYPIVGDEHLDNPPLYLEADQSSTIIGGLSRLQGGVTMRQGGRRLSSSSAELDQVTNKARLEGNVKFRETGLLMLSDTAQIDTNSSEAIFNNAQYVFHEDGLRGSADRVIRLEDERLRIENGDYTYCPPFSDAWKLEADNIVLNKNEGIGEAEDTVIRVGGVPVFYAPYFTFPIDDRRKSGFLYPSIGYSTDSGLDLSVPYYFNIAPNMDDTLTARHMSDRGLLLENEFRYLNKWSSNVLNTAYLPDDKAANDDRWLLGIKHKGSPIENWRTNVNYSAVSDEDYFEDLDTNLEVRRQNHLNQRADLTYNQKNWNFRVRVHDYQTIDKNSKSPYKKLPQITLKGENEFGAAGEFKYIAEYTQFDRNLSGLTGRDRIIGDRHFIMPTINYLWLSPWGYIKPELSLWNSSYSLDNQISGLGESPNISVPIFSLDSTVIFERAVNNGGTQTLEPRIYGLYVPEEDQDEIPDFDTSEPDFSYNSLFRYNRFSGKDRIGDAKQISLGLASRFYGQDGNEKGSLSIGQAYYFADRKVQLNPTTPDSTESQSDIATEAVWYLNQNFRASFDAILDNNDYSNTESNLRFRYNSDLDHRFDFSYRYEENKRKQTDLSFIWPLGGSWTSMGRWLHDIEENENLESALGLEYESCCWKVSFAGRRWLDDRDNYDTGMFLNFTLKGLGSFGSGSNSFLNDIIGYEEREEHNDK